MQQNILCEVSNCVYNHEGKKCSASEIFVVSHRGSQAENSRETDCNTFKPEDAL